MVVGAIELVEADSVVATIKLVTVIKVVDVGNVAVIKVLFWGR